jgi:hypothetical protein
MEMNSKVMSLYSSLAVACPDTLKENHGMFVTHVGTELQKHPLMFVGRETNGQGGSFGFSTYVEKDLDWLGRGQGYEYSGSPFFRVVGKVLAGHHGIPYDRNAYERMVWSNLYKIAPTNRRPATQRMHQIQESTCIDLLAEEILDLEPCLVVFLTDWWLNPFLDKWNNDGLITSPSKGSSDFFDIRFAFKKNDVLIPAIALPHPQNKSGNFREDTLIRLISELLNG